MFDCSLWFGCRPIFLFTLYEMKLFVSNVDEPLCIKIINLGYSYAEFQLYNLFHLIHLSNKTADQHSQGVQGH